MPHDWITTLRSSLCAVYRGNPDGVELVLIALLAGGHVLLEDIPGVGKTTLARALAQGVGGRFQRIQGTPDMMPSDITGLSIYDEQERRFRFHPGPIFCDVLIADELNRIPPRTQSALLEALSEAQVS
ncbi:MAG: AAA family ATPase, partial [Planctomycetota bacterium]